MGFEDFKWNGSVSPASLQEEPNAQVNRQKCGAFLSALNLQLDLTRGLCAEVLKATELPLIGLRMRAPLARLAHELRHCKL
jgi:hypothetical protein